MTSMSIHSRVTSPGGLLGRMIVGASAPATTHLLPNRLAMRFAEPCQPIRPAATSLESPASEGSPWGSDSGGS